MKHLPNKLFLMIAAGFSFTACQSISDKAENKLNDLLSKTESLDSIINKEVNKVLTLDSLINDERGKVKKLDSLINKNTSKLDSFANEKIRIYEKIVK